MLHNIVRETLTKFPRTTVPQSVEFQLFYTLYVNNYNVVLQVMIDWLIDWMHNN